MGKHVSHGLRQYLVHSRFLNKNLINDCKTTELEAGHQGQDQEGIILLHAGGDSYTWNQETWL